jgi:hypothetical protein
MSSFLGPTAGQTGVGIQQCADDIKLWPEYVRHDYRDNANIDAAWRPEGYTTGWWPGAVGLDASGGEWHTTIRWGRPEITRGHSGRLGFTGVTRDVYGTAVPGAVVKLFRTADDSLQYSGTSASDGSYTATTPYSDAHYLVSHKDDVIDTAGATVNTLIPA